jgi:hypothetical protein
MLDFLVPAGQTVAASIGSAALMFFGIPLLQKRKKGALHPAARTSSDTAWHTWDGRRWRQIRTQNEERD